MANQLRRHSITFLGVGIATALTAGVGYYVVAYRGAREHYFSESRRRQLGVLAEQMENAIDNRFSSLRNAVEYVFEKSIESRKGQLEDQLNLAGLSEVSCEPRKAAAASPAGGAANPSSQPTADRAAAESDPGKAAAAPQPTPKGEYVAETLEILPAANVQARETAALDFDSTTAAGSPVRKRNRKLRFCIDRGTDASGASAWNTREGDGRWCENGRICAAVTLDALIGPFLRGDGFRPGDFFVARGADILFESGSTDVRIGSVLEATRKEEAKSAATPTPATLTGPFPSADELESASLVRDVFVGGEWYRLFTQPVYVLRDQPWSLSYIVERHGFEEQVATLSFGSLSYLPLVLLIGILAMPFIKIRTMGSRERLKATDIRVLAFSLIALAGTASTLNVAVYDYYSLSAALDRELEEVSRRLRQNFAAELAQVTSALDGFVESHALSRALAWRAMESKELERTVEVDIFRQCRTANGPNGAKADDCPAPSTGSLWAVYPFFNMVFWGDRNSTQREKWSVGDTATPPIDTKETIPYRDARSGRLREVPTADAGVARVAVHLRLSGNTGKLVPVISMPMQSAQGDFVGVGGIIPELSALLDPALPHGFRFAVIETDGRVVMHSDASRSLYENFYEEGDCAAEIRSLVESRSAGVVSGTYRGRAQSLYVHPVEDSPWTLLVFRDREIPRTLLLDALLTWFALYGLYLGLAVVGVTLLRLFFRRDDGAVWLWPDGYCTDSYAASLLALLVAAMALLGVIVERPSSSIALLGASLALPLAAVSHVYLRLVWSPSAQRRRRTLVPAVEPQTAPAAKRRRTAAWIAWSLFPAAAILAVWTTWGDATAMALCAVAVGSLAFLANPWSRPDPASPAGAEAGSSAPPGAAPAESLRARLAAALGAESIAGHGVSEGLASTGGQKIPHAWVAWAVVAVGAAMGVLCAARAGRFASAAFYGLVALGCAFVSWDTVSGTRRVKWKQFYGWGAVVLVVLVGVLPATGFYQDVWDQSLEVFVRHGQMKTAERLDRRRLAILEEYKRRIFDVGPGMDADSRREVRRNLRDRRLASKWDIVSTSLFGEPLESPTPLLPTRTPTAHLSAVGTPGSPSARSETAASEVLTRAGRIFGRHFSGIVSAQLPVYHDESIELRELLDTRAADWRWSWDVTKSTAEFHWQAPVGDGKFSEKALSAAWPPFSRGSASSSEDGTSIENASSAAWSPLSVDRASLQRVVLLFFVLLPLLVSGYLIIRRLMSGIFGVGKLNELEPPPMRDYADFGRGLLVLRHGDMSQDLGAGVEVLDLRSPLKAARLRDPIPESCEVVLVKHLEERLEDLPTLKETLELLEKLLLGQRRKDGKEYLVVILCAIAPLSYLRRRLQSNADDEADKFITPEVIGRWARLLEQLARVEGEADPDVLPLRRCEIIEWFRALPPVELKQQYGGKAEFGLFAAETTQTARLRGIAWEVLWQKQIGSWWRSGVQPTAVRALALKGDGALRAAHSLEKLTNDVDQLDKIHATLAEATRAHYRALWSHLTDDEQLLLVQLAKEGYVNPNGWRLINGLLLRGLVRYTPAVRLMNESFRQFVASEETDKQVHDWEMADPRSSWERARSVILVLIIVAGVVLYLTQPERLTQMVGVIGALGGAAMTVANLFGLVGGGRPPPAATKS